MVKPYLEPSMLSPEKAALLQSLLGSLPAQAAARLARAVEVDRLAGGRVLGVRSDDIPGCSLVAAILRYAPAPS